jgi:hypothetical protein
MVPEHGVGELKPKSGELHGTRAIRRKEISDRRANDAQNNLN